MRKKHDMYIHYERVYKKRRSRSGRNIYKIFLIILLVLGFGGIAFYFIDNRIGIVDKIKGRTELISPTPKIKIQDPVVWQADNLTEEDRNNQGQISGDDTPLQVQSPTTVPVNNQNSNDTDTEEEEANVLIPVQVKGIYVNSLAAGSDKLKQLIEIADKTEINAMIIDVKDDQGRISYAMDSMMAQEIGAITNHISDIEQLIIQLKSKDIYLIARITAFKDSYLAEQKNEWAIKNKDGSLYRDSSGACWVNPYEREAWDYLMDIAAQAAEIGFDEIQFDHIRFPTGSRASKADYGEEAENITREKIILEFTKFAYEKLKPLGVSVSADVYGSIINSSTEAAMLGQNYEEMAKYLDYICPIIYPSNFEEGIYGVEYPDLEPYQIVSEVLKASKEKLTHNPEKEHLAIVRPWLQDFTAAWTEHHQQYGEKELKEQIAGVYAAGYKEWMIWNSESEFTVESLQAE
jgi:hypothetical protein